MNLRRLPRLVLVRIHSLRSACATSAMPRLGGATRPLAGGASLVLSHVGKGVSVVRRPARSHAESRAGLASAQGGSSLSYANGAVGSGKLAANPSINRTAKKLRFLSAGYVKRWASRECCLG